MTGPRKRMLEELQRRNYSSTTIGCYLRVVEAFAHYFGKRPDHLTGEHLREYHLYLLQERKLTPERKPLAPSKVLCGIRVQLRFPRHLTGLNLIHYNCMIECLSLCTFARDSTRAGFAIRSDDNSIRIECLPLTLV